MKFAVLGSTGMFGTEMLSLLNERGFNATGINRDGINLENCTLEQLEHTLEAFDVVINATAYTDVVAAEDHEADALVINGMAVGQLALACKTVGTRLIHISTDYVFDGRQQSPYGVEARVNPLNAYGRSKALGEQLIAEVAGDSLIVRTSWLYGAKGKCFPRTVAKRLISGEALTVVNDQIGQPTWTKDLAEQILAYSLLERMPRIAHVVAAGEASWFDFANAIAASLGLSDKELIAPIDSLQFESSVSRPKFSVLDTEVSPIDPIGNWLERWNQAAPEILENLGD